MLDDPATMDETPILLEPESTAQIVILGRDAYERLQQAQIALRDILSRLPETGRINASAVDWLRSVARAGLGEDGQRLITAQHAWLEMAARAIPEPVTCCGEMEYECLWCLSYSADGAARMIHDPDCPWLRLRAALGDSVAS